MVNQSMIELHILFNKPGIGLALGLWCLTPLSTIFQVYR